MVGEMYVFQIVETPEAFSCYILFSPSFNSRPPFAHNPHLGHLGSPQMDTPKPGTTPSAEGVRLRRMGKSRVSLDKAGPRRFQRGVRAIGGAQLGNDDLDMLLGSVFGNGEGPAYLLVGASFRHQPQHLQLPNC